MVRIQSRPDRVRHWPQKSSKRFAATSRFFRRKIQKLQQGAPNYIVASLSIVLDSFSLSIYSPGRCLKNTSLPSYRIAMPFYALLITIILVAGVMGQRPGELVSFFS